MNGPVLPFGDDDRIVPRARGRRLRVNGACAAAPARREARLLTLGAIIGVYLGDALSNVVDVGSAYLQIAGGTVLGLAFGLLAGRWPRLTNAALGLTLGALAGYVVSSAYLYARIDGGYANASSPGQGVGMAAGAGLGLGIALLAGRWPIAALPALGLALGILVGHVASFVLGAGSAYVNVSTPGSDYTFDASNVFMFATGLRPIAYVTTGAALGLALGLLADRRPRLATPTLGLALGTLVGHVVSSTERLTRYYSDDSLDYPHITHIAISNHGAIVGPVAGAILGLGLGTLADHHSRLAPAALGLSLGSAAGILGAQLFWSYLCWPPGDNTGYDTFGYGYGPALCLPLGAALGLGLGLLSTRYPWVGRSVLGLTLGAAATALAADTASFMPAYGWIPLASAGAGLGLGLGLRSSGLPRLATSALGLALGILAGGAAAFTVLNDLRLPAPDGDYGPYPALGIAAGAVLGLGGALLAGPCPRLGRTALGALAGAFAGGSGLLFLSCYPSTVMVGLGGVTGAAVTARRQALGWSSLPVGRTGARRPPEPARQVLKLLRPGTFARGVVGLAAAIAAGDQRRERYSEEFDATLAGIGGRVARTRRLWCALTILASAARLRIELTRNTRHRS